MSFPKFNIAKIITSLILGFNSGLTYALIGSTFTAYLHDNKVDLTMISLLSARALPYSSKYIWAPLVDNLNINIFPKEFGQRKMWIITMQVLIIISLFLLSALNIKINSNYIFILSFIIAFLAATYDIAMEAYRIELFTPSELNKGNLANVLGFRIGLLITGAGGLYASHYVSWSAIFICSAILIIPCAFIVYNSVDDRVIDNKIINFKDWLGQYLIEPLSLLIKIPNFFLIVQIIAFYKLSDNYLDTMIIPFLIEAGYTKLQIATIVKAIGIGAGVVGAVIGSMVMNKIDIIKNLFFIEVLAALSNLLFILLIGREVNSVGLTLVIIVENAVSGFSNIILISYMSSLCDRRFTATHYAILASISGIFRTLISMSAGQIAANHGWITFFIISALLSVPSLICLRLLYTKIKQAN